MPFLKIYVDSPSNAIDLVPYIEEMKWSENDLDSPNSGRDLSGMMYRGKVTSKRRCDIKLITLSAGVINQIFSIIRSEYFWCNTDLAPADGELIMNMYNSTRTGGIAIITTDNEAKHKDVSFNIIER